MSQLEGCCPPDPPARLQMALCMTNRAALGAAGGTLSSKPAPSLPVVPVWGWVPLFPLCLESGMGVFSPALSPSLLPRSVIHQAFFDSPLSVIPPSSSATSISTALPSGPPPRLFTSTTAASLVPLAHLQPEDLPCQIPSHSSAADPQRLP